MVVGKVVNLTFINLLVVVLVHDKHLCHAVTIQIDNGCHFLAIGQDCGLHGLSLVALRLIYAQHLHLVGISVTVFVHCGMYLWIGRYRVGTIVAGIVGFGICILVHLDCHFLFGSFVVLLLLRLFCGCHNRFFGCLCFLFLLLLLGFFVVEHFCGCVCGTATDNSAHHCCGSSSGNFLSLVRLLFSSFYILCLFSLIVVLRLHDDCFFVVHTDSF